MTRPPTFPPREDPGAGEDPDLDSELSFPASDPPPYGQPTIGDGDDDEDEAPDETPDGGEEPRRSGR